MTHILVARGALALSDDLGVECILAVIPLLCMGIMSFGTFTFVLVMKRVDILVIQLFISCFLGFVAALLELGQILIRGQFNVVNGLGIAEVADYTRAREVILALSTGFLYLFYWLFAGRPPTPEGENEVSRGSAAMRRMAIETPSKPTHCARWERWGYVGIGLKWVTLAGCLLIVALQMVWRLAPRFRVYGDLYVASATMETTISAIFILKLLLNLYLAPLRYQKQVLLNYITPTAAFILSASVGVGNLIVFAFSETSLGRFLRGVEVYLLIIYYLIIKFQEPDTPPQPEPLPAPIERNGSKEKVTFDLRPPSRLSLAVPTLTALAVGKPNPSTEGLWRISRMSDLSKMSSWVTSNRNSRRSFGKDLAPRPQSWQSNYEPPKRSLLLEPRPASVYEAPSAAGDRISTQYNEDDDKDSDSNDTNEDDSDELIGNDIVMLPPSLSFNRNVRLTDLSFSYYAMESDLTAPKTSVGYDSSTLGSNSPVYGLNGITLPRGARRSSLDVTTQAMGAEPARPGDMTPVTRLIQEQSVIDSTIANLRRQISLEKDNGNTRLQPSSRMADFGSSKSTADNQLPPDNASEFSLSVFPDPPRPETPLTIAQDSRSDSPPGPMPRPKAARRMPPAGVIPIQLSIPSGVNASMNSAASPRYDSARTQYDVTSFIGDLSVPQSGYPPLSGNITSSGVMPTASIAFSDFQSEGDVTPTQQYIPSGGGGGSPNSSPLSRTPTRPLGSATMSSSFPRPGARNATDQPTRPLAPQNMALRTFLTRNGSDSARGTPPGQPAGPRHSRSLNSLTNRKREDIRPL